MEIKIGKKIIGKDKPCFIIAEAGVNHNGDKKIAKKLIDAAKDSGADAVKFQTFKTEGVVTRKTGIASYAKKNIGKDISQFDMIKKYEIDYKIFVELKNYCDSKNIIFLSTPHSYDAIEFLDKIIPAYKIGSGDLTNIPVLKEIAKKGKPIFLGTGMSTLKEVKFAIDSIKSEGNNQIVAMHCTTNYPCKHKEVNLRAIKTMQQELDCLIGFSDHTIDLYASVMAASLGAVLIERHMTLDKNLKGPDHKASLEPHQLKDMISQIRICENILGSYKKEPTKSEKDIMDFVRKSIVAQMDIKKGVTITKDMIAIKRPGIGISPSKINEIIGKTAKQTIEKDELILLEMVE